MNYGRYVAESVVPVGFDGQADGPFGGRLRTVLTAGIVAIVGIPFVVVAALWLHRGYVTTSDVAMIELRIRDMGRDLPATGVYSRFGYQHPGPAMFYLLWLPYHLLGGSGAALVASMVIWSAVLVSTLLALLGRHLGPVAAGLGAISVLVTVQTLGWKSIIEPWNPHMATLGGLALIGFLLLSLDHSPSAAALVPIVATILVQAHLGAAVFVVIIMGIWIGLPFIDWFRARGREQVVEDRPNLVRGRWIGGVVALLLWAPPILDQVAGAGNLGKIVRASLESDSNEPVTGWAAGLKMTTMSWSIPPWWGTKGVHGPLELLGPIFRIPWLLLAVLALFGIAALRGPRWRRLLSPPIVVAGVVIAMPPTFSNIHGMPWAYLVTWIPGAVVACCAIAIAAAWTGPRPLGPSVHRATFAVLAVATTGLMVTTSVGAIRSPEVPIPKPLEMDARVQPPSALSAERIWNGIKPELPINQGAVLLRSELTFAATELVPGVVVLADRDGVRLMVEPRFSSAIVSDRIADSAPTELLILNDLSAQEALAKYPDQILVTDNPFSEKELSNLRTLWKQVASAAERGDTKGEWFATQEVMSVSRDRRLTVVRKLEPQP